MKPENRQRCLSLLTMGRKFFACMSTKLPHWHAPPRDCGWLLAAASLAAFPAVASGPGVHWATEQLSVKARGEPLGTVLREIALQTGVAIEGGYALAEPVASDFAKIPLVEGLRRLLAGQNYLIVEEPRSNPADLAVTRVVVLANLGSPATPTVVEARSGALARPVERAGNDARNREVTSAGLPLPAAPAPERAVMDGDPAVRIEAVEALGRRVDANSLALLRGALSDPSEAVRAVAVEALNTRRSSSSLGARPGP